MTTTATIERRTTRDRLLRQAEALIGPDKTFRSDEDRAAFEKILTDVERLGAELQRNGAGASDRKFNMLPSLREYREAEARAMGSVSGSGGGFLVDGEMSAEFFDRLRPASVVLAAGPRVLEMEGATLSVPKLSTSVTVAVYAENGEITATDASIGALVLRANKLAALVRGSNEWFVDSNGAAREILSMDLVKSVASKIDYQCLEGIGSGGDFAGLRRHAGTTTEIGNADGTTPSPDDVLDAIQRLSTNNATASAIFMHPRSWGVFKQTKDGTGRYVFSPDPSAAAPLSMFGVPVFLSSQISITETVGSSTDCSWIAVVDMSQVVFARRLDTAIVYDQSRYLEYDQTGVRVVARADFAPVNSAGVEIITGVRE